MNQLFANHSLNNNAVENNNYTYEKIATISEWLLSKVSKEDFRPRVGIICGSGLSDLADSLIESKSIPYEQIPGFPKSTVEGHKGNLVLGYLNNTPVVCMQGRFHAYEGYSSALVCMPLKLFKILGVKTVILTCASGSINRSYEVGDLILIKDHIAPMLWTLQHPLVGLNDDKFGPRFPAANRIYTKELRDLFLEVAEEKKEFVKEGVYLYLSGPSFETVSELLFFSKIGADCLGASTAHEALVSSYCGMDVLAIALITNQAVMEYDSKSCANHGEVIETAKRRAKDLESLIKEFVQKLENL